MQLALIRLFKFPPWNVAILCVIWMAFSVLMLIAVGPKPSPIPPLSPPDPHCAFDCDGLPFWSVWDFGIAPYAVGVGIAQLTSALLAALGSRIGRNCLLASIVLFTIWVFAEGVAMIRLLGRLELLSALRAWLFGFTVKDALGWLTWFAWVGLNFWCFLGARARRFYAQDT